MGFPIASELDIADALRAASIDEFDGSSRSARGPGTGLGTGSGTGSREPREVVSPVRLGIGRWSRWVAVAGGFGYVPVAPGTAGSLAGVLVFFGLLALAASGSSIPFLALYGAVSCGLLVLGIRAAGRAEVDFGRRDDGRIVIDEVVGQLVALAPLALIVAAPLSAGLPAGILATDEALLFFFEVVTGFVLFRLFDVWKPGAIRWAERRFEGGLGVMADDVVAGLHAAIGVWLIHALVFERLYSTLLGSRLIGSTSLAATSVGIGGPA